MVWSFFFCFIIYSYILLYGPSEYFSYPLPWLPPLFLPFIYSLLELSLPSPLTPGSPFPPSPWLAWWWPRLCACLQYYGLATSCPQYPPSPPGWPCSRSWWYRFLPNGKSYYNTALFQLLDMTPMTSNHKHACFSLDLPLAKRPLLILSLIYSPYSPVLGLSLV